MDELERIRHEKMAQMMKRIESQKKQAERKKETENKSDQFLQSVMVPDAYEYYKKEIVSQRPRIARRIFEVLQQLISAGVVQTRLSKDELIFIDRRLSGVGPNIKVKRPGKEYTDIAAELTGKK